VRFENVDQVGHPIESVFHLVRDEMPKLVPYLNDVESIVVETFETRADGKIECVNVWHGSDGKVPALVRKFLKPDALCWTDYAVWTDDASDRPRRAEWRLEPRIGANLFTCTGTTSVIPDGEGACQIKIEGDLQVYPERLPGIPKLLAGKVRGKIESFVVALLVPNMQTMALGVQNYFDDEQSGRLDSVE